MQGEGAASNDCMGWGPQLPSELLELFLVGLQESQCVLGFVSASVSPSLETDSVFLAQKYSIPAADSNKGQKLMQEKVQL